MKLCLPKSAWISLLVRIWSSLAVLLLAVYSTATKAQTPIDSRVEWGTVAARQRLPKSTDQLRLVLKRSTQLCDRRESIRGASLDRPWSLILHYLLISSDGALVTRVYQGQRRHQQKREMAPPAIRPPLRALAYRREVLTLDQDQYVVEMWSQAPPYASHPSMKASRRLTVSHPSYIVQAVIIEVESSIMQSPVDTLVTRGRTPHLPRREAEGQSKSSLRVCGFTIKPETKATSVIMWQRGSAH